MMARSEIRSVAWSCAMRKPVGRRRSSQRRRSDRLSGPGRFRPQRPRLARNRRRARPTSKPSSWTCSRASTKPDPGHCLQHRRAMVRRCLRRRRAGAASALRSAAARRAVLSCRTSPTATKADIATCSCRCPCAWSEHGVPAQEARGDRRQGALPGFIEPALATSIEKVPTGDRWIHEIKFDGYRVQVHLANDRQSRYSPAAATTGPTASRRSPPTLGTSAPAPRSSTARSSCRPPTAPPTFRCCRTS